MSKKIGILSILFSVIMSLVSCGGSGGVPAKAPAAKLDGTATDAVITNGVLKIYAFDGGVKGDLITQTTTDAKGDFHFDTFTSPDRPIMIEVSGGSYTEEASGVSVDLLPGQILRAYMYYQQGSEVTVQVTPLTHLASCLADYKIRMGENVNNAITEATSVFSGLAGIDILGTKPIDITDPNNADFQVTDGLRYGTLLAAISSLTAEISQTNGVTPHRFNQNSSIFATQVLCQDISLDGIFNGLGTIGSGSTGQLSLGSVPLDADTFRTKLAQHILSVISSDRNATGLGVNDYVLYANEVASSTDAIFGGVPPTAVDQEGPVVTANLAPDSFLKGIVDLNFTVTDPIGVKSVQFKVNDVVQGSAQVDNPVLSLNTSNYTDGTIKISVVATDTLNNESVVDYNYVVDNASPTIALTSSLLVANKNYTATGTYQEEGAPVSTITVNGVSAAIDTAQQTWSADLTLVSGNNDVAVTITDAVGNVGTYHTTVGVDLIIPTITVYPSPATFTTYQGQLNLCTLGNFTDTSAQDNPLCVSTDNLSLNGTAIDSGLTNDGYLTIAFAVTDTQGAGVFSDNADLQVDYSYTKNGTQVVDWTAAPRQPDNSVYYLPVTTEYMGSTWYQGTTSDTHTVQIRVTDKAGNVAYHTWNFKVDVLSPIVSYNTTIQNSSLFTSNSFSNRSAINGQLVNVAYDFTNSSNTSAFYISLSGGDASGAVQTYTKEIRHNRAEVDWTQTRQALGYSTSTATQASSYVTFTSAQLWNGSAWVNDPSFFTAGTMQDVYSDTITASAIDWTSNVPYSQFCTGPLASIPSTSGISSYGTERYSSGSSTYVACLSFTYNGVTSYSANIKYKSTPTITYESGYPRNESTDTTLKLTMPTESLIVYNNTDASAINPVDGWYRIPAGANITITKSLRTPAVTNYTDTDVGSSTFNSYTAEYLDKTITWNVDTDLIITRASDTGDTSTLSSATQYVETIGNGISSFSLTR